MVSTILYNRSDITRDINTIWGYVEAEDYRSAKIASNQLLSSLLKYYKTRGISANHFYDLFDNLNYQITYCSPGSFKRRIVFDELEKIIKEIKTSTKDPVMRLKEIYDDIRHLFYNIDKDNVEEIIGCFDELNQLQPEMKEIGGTIYNFYTTMMQKVGDCESTMLRVNQTSKTDSLFQTLDAKFSAFFQAAHKVLSPPVELVVKRDFVYDAIKKGATIEDISEATSHSDEEIRAMLQTEEMLRQQGEENG